MRCLAPQQSRIALYYTFFLLLLLTGIVFLLVGPNVLSLAITSAREDADARRWKEYQRNVRQITTVRELNEAVSTGCCVLFVDGYWNAETAMFRTSYAKFGAWSKANAGPKTVTVELDSNSSNNELLHNAVQDLWKRNEISPGGMKNSGGAGRVVWFQEGIVVDYAWCIEVMEPKGLIARTKRSFP